MGPGLCEALRTGGAARRIAAARRESAVMSFWADMWLTATVCGVAANLAFLMGNRREFRRILRSHRELRAARDASLAACEGARELAMRQCGVLEEQMRRAARERAELEEVIAKGDRTFGITTRPKRTLS